MFDKIVLTCIFSCIVLLTSPMHVATSEQKEDLEEEIKKFWEDYAKRDDVYTWRTIRFMHEDADPDPVFWILDAVLNADPTTLDHDDLGQFLRLVSPQFNKLVEKGTGASLLHIVARGGALDIVKVLLAAGVDPMTRDIEGNTALHDAAMYGRNNVVRYLLENRFIDVNSKNHMGNTPLHNACFYARQEVLATLLEFEADATHENEYKQMPLHHLMMCQKITERSDDDVYNPDESIIKPLLKILIQQKKISNLDHKDSWRASPIRHAVGNGFVGTVQLLQEHGLIKPKAAGLTDEGLRNTKTFWKIFKEEGQQSNKRR